MKTVLLTGAFGFIGSHVVEELHRRGYQVFFFDRFIKSNDAEKISKADGVFFGDIRDASAIDEAVRNCDGAINLAGLLGTAEAVADPMPAAQTNIIGGLNFLEAIRKYGKPGVQITVGNHFENNTYSITKTTIERFALMYQKEHGVRVAVVRGLNAYGPGQHHKPIRKITPNFVTSALRGDPIKIYGDGLQVMDMIYVKDLASILVSALEMADSTKDIGFVIEAGTGRHTTVNKIAEVIINDAQKFANAYTDGDKLYDYVPMRPGETPHSVVVADTKTLPESFLLRLPKNRLTTLEEGMLETVEWYFNNYDFKHD
jgi:nucleoside-diphosphate-sugar epimerase